MNKQTEFGRTAMLKSKLSKGYDRIDKPKNNDYNITLKDLEGRYKAFCVYSREPRYHGMVFKLWGLGRVGSTFK